MVIPRGNFGLPKHLGGFLCTHVPTALSALPLSLRFKPPFSDRKILGVTRDQRTVLGNGMNHNHSQALARRTTHPVLHYTGFIHEKVRVGRTVQLVDKALIHVHDHCSFGFLFRKCTAHFYEKPANSGLPLLVEGGDFDPSSAASIAKPIQQPSYRAVRHLNIALLFDPFAYGTSENLLSAFVLGTDEGAQLSALLRVEHSPPVLSGRCASPLSRRRQKCFLVLPMSPDLLIAQERAILQLAVRTEAKQNKRVEVLHLSGASIYKGTESSTPSQNVRLRRSHNY